MISALCRVLGLLENSTVTVPTSSSPWNAPNEELRPDGSAMRLTHQASGSAARSSGVEVKALDVHGIAVGALACRAHDGRRQI